MADKPQVLQNLVREHMIRCSRVDLLTFIFGDLWDPEMKNEVHIKNGPNAGRVDGDFDIVFVLYTRTERSEFESEVWDLTKAEVKATAETVPEPDAGPEIDQWGPLYRGMRPPGV